MRSASARSASLPTTPSPTRQLGPFRPSSVSGPGPSRLSASSDARHWHAASRPTVSSPVPPSSQRARSSEAYVARLSDPEGRSLLDQLHVQAAELHAQIPEPLRRGRVVGLTNRLR